MALADLVLKPYRPAMMLSAERACRQKIGPEMSSRPHWLSSGYKFTERYQRGSIQQGEGKRRIGDAGKQPASVLQNCKQCQGVEGKLHDQCKPIQRLVDKETRNQSSGQCKRNQQPEQFVTHECKPDW